jgi:hypothetical protein
MKNINEYDKEKFFQNFATSDISLKVKKDFDKLSWDKNFKYEINTPRQLVGDKNLETVFSMAPFYYINRLLETNPSRIYDLGCGWNIFKKYIPNIIGVGAENPTSKFYHADVHDLVDDDYINNHQNYFESFFSINALHFHPIDDLKKVVLNFISMSRKHGRGFLALNFQRMFERAKNKKFLDKNFDFDFYIRNELYCINVDYLIFDVDLSVKDDPMDGNIRLVFEKN